MDGYYSGQKTNQDMPIRPHEVVMKNRKTIDITGVKLVESFDQEEFLLETVMGFLTIKGQNLKMRNLNIEDGLVSIEGMIHSYHYLDDHSAKEPGKTFLSKLFR